MTKTHASGAELHILFKEIFRLHTTLSEVIDEVHEKAGMRTSQIRLANTLMDLNQATVPDVAHAMKVSRQFVQTTVNELEKMGMLVFMENPRHKRSKLLELTAHGRETLKQASINEEAIIQQLLPEMDASNVVIASKLLEGVRKKMNTYTSTKVNSA